MWMWWIFCGMCVCIYTEEYQELCVDVADITRKVCVYMCIYGGNPGAVDTADIRRNVDVLI